MFTLRDENEAWDPVFKSLWLDGIEYTQVENLGGFSQWIYLVYPEAFALALKGTTWEGTGVGYVCKEVSVQASMGRVEWEICVNYIVSAFSGDGIELVQRPIKLVFSR
jgi:hypothetical protein